MAIKGTTPRVKKLVVAAMLSAASAALAFAGAVGAEPIAAEVALADALYRQARELMAQGQFEQACPKLSESYRLDRATGTLLNLAACHERVGKVATSWLEYSDAAEAARRDGRPDRVTYAEERSRALQPLLSRLTLITLATKPNQAVEQDGLEIRLDGALIGPAARGVPTLVDPGHHAVEAKAPGKVPWRHDVDVNRPGEQLTVTIPQLDDAAPEATNGQVSAGGHDGEGHHPLEKTGASPSRVAPGDRPPGARPTPAAVYWAGASTAALGVATGITGVLYLQQRSASRGGDVEAFDSARALGWANVALWASTAAAASVTTYLYVTRPEPVTSGALRVVPCVAPGGGGLALAGAF